MNVLFEPTLEAAAARLAAVNPEQYARSRNALQGAVTRLSPYFTHGLLDLPDALEKLGERHTLPTEHKLVMEFGWREFFAHVWQHQGPRIFSDLRPAITGRRYARTLPEDIRTASTGVPAIDHAVRALYNTGYLHNHARLWLASYVVHLRKVHWRLGADWLYGHLLDGDLASNHLSWQWVAGTFSVKPYLFNAENVARYAPAAWHSPGTVIDTSYEALDALARDADDVGPEPTRPEPVAEPPLFAAPPDFSAAPLPELASTVTLVHPWALGAPAADDGMRVGLIHTPFHSQHPWSARRWQFVLARMAACTEALFVGDAHTLRTALAGRTVHSRATLNPGYAEALPTLAGLQSAPTFLQAPPRFCQSFSKFYGSAERRLPTGRWHA